jgi:hypothetical protein
MSDQKPAKPAAKKSPAKKKAPAKHPGGRPSPYVERVHPKLAYALAVRGLTDEQMAEEIGISIPTFYAWQKKHPEFLKALKDGKENPDAAVEGALFKKAVGFKQLVKKPMVASGVVEIIEFEQTVDPDTTAQIFYLKNRRPDRWRDKQEVEHTGELNFTNLTPEEFEKRKAELLAKVGKK